MAAEKKVISGPLGVLYVVGTPIGNLSDISFRAIEILRSADIIACEDTRRTRKLLTYYELSSGARLISLHEHNEESQINEIVTHLESGRQVALVSDAGMPTISDPGFKLIDALLSRELEVTVIPGPSSVLAALALSGFASYRFCFEGFLPLKKSTRERRLEEIANEVRTIVIFESPYRIVRTMGDLRNYLEETRRVFVVKEITKVHETIWRGSIGSLDPFSSASPASLKGEFVIVIEGKFTKDHNQS